MSNFVPKSKLTAKEQEELLMDLCDAVSSLHDAKEAARFLKDLLSPQEAEMLAKRVKIAELLLAGWDYREIKDHLKVAEGTIARVSEWLKYSGDGYRVVVERLKDKRKSRIRPEPLGGIGADIRRFKRKYPAMFWPELLMADIIKNSKIKKRKEVLAALAEIRSKPSLYKKISKELREHLLQN